MHYLERKALVDHLKYDTDKKVYLLKIEQVADFLFRQEHQKKRRFFMNQFNRSNLKDHYIERARHLIFRLINEWNFQPNHSFKDVLSEENIAQTTLKLKVFYGENPSFKEILLLTGSFELFNHTYEELKNSNLKDSETLETRAQAVFFKITGDNRVNGKWKRLNANDKLKWLSLAKILQDKEWENIAAYHQLALDFFQFEKQVIKDSYTESKIGGKSNMPATVSIGKEIYRTIVEERQKEENLMDILNVRAISDHDKADFIFVIDNPYFHEDYMENIHFPSPPLVWNVVESNSIKDVYHLSVDRNFIKAVIRYNIFNFESLTRAAKRIVLEEDGDIKHAVDYLKQLEIIDCVEGELHIKEDFNIGSRILVLPRNYLDILRIQIQIFLKKAA